MEWIVEAETLKDVFSRHRVCFRNLVRCRDCKYWKDLGGIGGHDANFCYHPVVNKFTTEDFFCAKGVRKSNECK